jgi:hypothetical protein
VEIVQEVSLQAPDVPAPASLQVPDVPAPASHPDVVADITVPDSDPDDPEPASRHDVVDDISDHDDEAPTPTQVIFFLNVCKHLKECMYAVER